MTFLGKQKLWEFINSRTTLQEMLKLLQGEGNDRGQKLGPRFKNKKGKVLEKKQMQVN